MSPWSYTRGRTQLSEVRLPTAAVPYKADIQGTDREPNFSNPEAQLKDILAEITQGVSEFDLAIRRYAEQNDSGIYWICLVS